MPYLVASSRDSEELRGHALAEGGRRLTELAVTFGKIYDQRKEERARYKLAQKRLELERARAERQLERDKQRAADVEGAVQGIQEEGARATDLAGRQGFQSQMASDALGVLGPFGLVTAAVRGAQARAQMEKAVAHDVEIAKRMSPEGARAHLAGRKAQYARAALTTGYNTAKQMIMRGADPEGDAVLTPADARELNATLQSAIDEGESADGVIKEIGKRYRLHGATRQRAKDWEAADAKAQEFLASVQQLADQAPEGFDPNTGTSAKAAAAKRLADAQAEWTQTEYGSFRMRNDPAESLAALKKMVLEGEAEQNPDAFIRKERQGDVLPSRVRGRPLGPEDYAQGDAEAAGATGQGWTPQTGMGPQELTEAPPQGKAPPEPQYLQKPHGGRAWADLKPAQQKSVEQELVAAVSAGQPIGPLLAKYGISSISAALRERLKAAKEARIAKPAMGQDALMSMPH